MRDQLPVSIPTLVLVALAGAVLIGVVVAGSSSAAAFNAYNPDWDGGSELRSQAEAAGAESTIVTDVSAYDGADPNGTIAVILAPDEQYGSDDAASVREFVAAGGTVLIADDRDGRTNELLADLNASTRIDGTPLRDERNYYRTPAFPLTTNATDQAYVTGLDEFTLNHGTTLAPGDAQILLETTEYAYLDDNRNEELDDDEELQVRPVATLEAHGEGQVLVVSDPSAMINVMLEREDNSAFLQRVAGDHERLLLDTSHSDAVPPLVRALLFVRGSGLTQLLVGTLALLAVGAWQQGRIGTTVDRLRDKRRPTGDVDPGRLSEQELDAWLAREHPEWDADRRETVMTAVIGSGTEREDND
jgi:hypothetical protein